MSDENEIKLLKLADRGILIKLNTSDVNIASQRIRGVYPFLTLLGKGVNVKFFSGDQPVSFLDRPHAIIFIKAFKSYDIKLARIAKRRGMVVYFDLCDNLFEKEGDAALWGRNITKMCGLADYIVVPSEDLKLELTNVLGPSFELKFKIIEDSIDVDDFNNELANFNWWQLRHWMLDNGKVWFLYFGIPKIFAIESAKTRKAISAVYKTLKRPFVLPFRGISNLTKRVFRYLIFQVLLDSKSRSTFIEISNALKKGQELDLNTQATTEFNKQTNLPTLTGRALPIVTWFGNAGTPGLFGLTDLLLIGSELKKLFSEIPFILRVISNDYSLYRQVITKLGLPNTEFISWDKNRFSESFDHSSVCIIPNGRNKFSRCKSSNRAVLALYHGVPVVATKTGALVEFNECILFDNFYESLKAYLSDEELRMRHLEVGRKFVELRFHPKKIANGWLTLISGNIQ